MEPLFAMFKLNRLSSGRRLSLYNQLQPLAAARDLTALVAHIERARDHDLMTRELDDRWASPDRRNLYVPEVSLIDNQVDPLLTQLRDIAAAHIADLDAGDPLRERVEAMLAEIFPAGVAAITSLPFVDEVAAVERIITALQGVHAATAVELALQRKVARLAELTAAYREAVDSTEEPLAFATVDAHRRRGHGFMIEIAGMIIGTFYDSENPEHLAARAELLDPIVENHDKAALQRARRAARDGEPGEPPIDGEPGEPPIDSEPGEPPIAGEPGTAAAVSPTADIATA